MRQGTANNLLIIEVNISLISSLIPVSAGSLKGKTSQMRPASSDAPECV
jgi:hypothetical protein